MGSVIPLVLEYLVSRCRAEMTDVLVTDGQPIPPEDIEPDVLCIGFTGEISEVSVENTRDRAQFSTKTDHETFEITSVASAWRGHDTDPVWIRRRAFEIVDQVASIISKDQTLGGLVMRSHVITDAMAQEQTDKGAVCTIRFNIRIIASVRR